MMNSGLSKRVDTTGGSLRLLPHRIIARMLLALSPKAIVDGFEVSALNGTLTPHLIAHLRSAIALIGDRDPRLLARIRKDVKRILLVSAGGPEYWPFANGFILNTSFVTQSDIEFIALTIVHEATHARLWKRGLRYGTDVRERIERICVDAELAFASHLKDPGYFSTHVTQKLATPWWTAAQVTERRRRARDILWPRWLVRAHAKIFDR
jgi:hypothetical protein